MILHQQTMALLSYSIASGIPVTLTRVKCWNINHQNHKHTYSHEPHDQNDKSNRCHTLYDCDDWYFSIWHVSMSLEFHWQLSNWVGLLWCTWWTRKSSHNVSAHNSPTQLLNCQWNSCDIDTCQMLKYQSSQPYKVLHLLDLSFWSWTSWEYVCLWFWWLIF